MTLFDRLDSYYQNRKPSEVWLMVGLFSLVIGYMLYTLLEPISTEYRQREESRNQNLRNSIESSQNYIKSITVNGDKNFYIKQLNRKIVKKRVVMNELRGKLVKLDSTLKDFNSLLYTKNNWSKFLHNITVNAKKNNLKVNSISDRVYDNNASFAKVLDVNIDVKGKYGELLNFMNMLEQTELVANISAVTLKASKDQPRADINLTVWGIKP